MNIIHHGGFNQVTGSCHELQLSSGQRYLVDCGLQQGSDAHEEPSIDFSVSGITAVLLTHCHLDHVGRLPYLFAAGFNGPIYATEATVKLLPLVIADAVKIGITRDRTLIEALLDKLTQQLVPCSYDQLIHIGEHVQCRFRNAGHIMGSAFIECDVADVEGAPQRVVFSGDIGCYNTPLLQDPATLQRADLLLLESTYGDRLHETRSHREQTLERIIRRCVTDRGAVLIPAFSIGRTQELLYELEAIWHRLEVAQQDDFPEVIVDSPLAAEFTELYQQLQPLWDDEAKQRTQAGRHPLSFDHCHTIADHDTHMTLVNRLRSTAEPVIIIAASGMCSGGRIVNYLTELLPDPRTDVLFVGYQAEGTPGYDIQRYGPTGGYVMLDNQRVTINAAIHTLGGYSAHADQRELLDFIGRASEPVKRVRLIHGEPAAQKALAEQITQRFNIPVETAAGIHL